METRRETRKNFWASTNSQQTTNSKHADAHNTGSQTEPMQRAERHHLKKRIRIAEWCQRPDVGVHDTVQNDVGVRACNRSQDDRPKPKCSPLERR